jgi:hypothetical protein
LDELVRELDILIRARYPLIAVNTFEENRFCHLMTVVTTLERHHPKGLFLWSRTQGLRQVAGSGLGPRDKNIPDTDDPLSVLDHIATADRGLFVLCDYVPYLAPFGQEEPLLVRRLRELAWAIKTKPVTVLMAGPSFPSIPALEKEVKVIDLPLPDEREVTGLLDLELARLAENPDVNLAVDARAHEQLVQALLGLTESEIENALAKDAGCHSPERRPHLQPPRTGRSSGRLCQSPTTAAGSGCDLHPGGTSLWGRADEGDPPGRSPWDRQRPH